MSNFYTGMCVMWVKRSGWGFIEFRDDDGEVCSVYTHNSQIKGKRLWKGQYVRFRLSVNEHGPIAVDVEPIFNKR